MTTIIWNEFEKWVYLKKDQKRSGKWRLSELLSMSPTAKADLSTYIPVTGFIFNGLIFDGIDAN